MNMFTERFLLEVIGNFRMQARVMDWMVITSFRVVMNWSCTCRMKRFCSLKLCRICAICSWASRRKRCSLRTIDVCVSGDCVGEGRRKRWACRQNEEQASICIKGNIAVDFSEHVFIVGWFPYQTESNSSFRYHHRALASPSLSISSTAAHTLEFPSESKAGSIVYRENLRAAHISQFGLIESNWFLVFNEILSCSLIQSIQSFEVRVYKNRELFLTQKCLENVASVISDALKSRNVTILQHSLFPPNDNALWFILSGLHVQSLFGLPPMNDVAYLYGYLDLGQNQMNGEIRLDGVTNCEDIEALMQLFEENVDSKLNNLFNTLRYDVAMLFHTTIIGRDWKGLLDGNMRGDPEAGFVLVDAEYSTISKANVFKSALFRWASM